MKRILLLTDFSKNSKNAIDYALHMHKDDLCVFYVLYVKSITSYTTDDLMSSGTQSIYNSLLKSEKTKLIKLVSTLQVDYHNEHHSFHSIADYDNFIDSIKQVVESKKIDLIVMGTNGVTGAKEVMFGSNTINVIRNINCDTLVIPEGYIYKTLTELLLPLDAFDSLQGKIFAELSIFIKKYKLTLHILRINPSDDLYDVEVNDIDDRLNGNSYTYQIVKDVPMHYAVESYLQTNSIDMMALIVQKESLLERFFIGSPTTHIGNHLIVPLLILHS